MVRYALCVETKTPDTRRQTYPPDVGCSTLIALDL